MRRLFSYAGVTVGLLGQLSCSDTTAPDLTGTTYTLALVDGTPLPVALDTTERSGELYERRLVARSLTVLSRDNVQYAERMDLVRLLPDGTWEATGLLTCFSTTGSYTVRRQRMTVNVNAVLQASGEPVVRHDVLTIAGDSLIQEQNGQRITFRAGAPAEAVCPLPEPE